ncbi:MAG: ribosome biogenesis GTPase YlqF [Eubacteriales bacterium]|nr:ribosome biogenesis GTPase YlqF [Eubacteriales bacterium]
MQINWYPGHMAKARRMLQENLRLTDVVIEIVDARAPLASRNPDFDDLFAGKQRVILLNKSDLSNRFVTKQWIAYYKKQGIYACEITATSSQGKAQAIALIEQATKDMVNKQKEKGVQKTVRALVVGIPNVGKSTFINQIAGAKRTQTGDRPGVTKGKQWVKITPYLELMDSPGLLWPKLEDASLAMHLAFIGSINDEIMDVEQLATELLYKIQSIDSAALTSRYGKVLGDTLKEELLNSVCRSRGFLLSGGVLDTERGARIVLDEYRGGKIAKISLDLPPREDI